MAPFRKLVLELLRSHVALRTFYGRSKYHGIPSARGGGGLVVRCGQKMVRGGPAKRTVKRAKIFALDKVGRVMLLVLL